MLSEANSLTPDEREANQQIHEQVANVVLLNEPEQTTQDWLDETMNKLNEWGIDPATLF